MRLKHSLRFAYEYICYNLEHVGLGSGTLTNGLWQKGEHVFLQVEVGEVCQSSHGERQHHQLVLRELEESQVAEVANLLQSDN